MVGLKLAEEVAGRWCQVSVQNQGKEEDECFLVLLLAACLGGLCGDGCSRHTAPLIGLHRLRPANSEHQ